MNYLLIIEHDSRDEEGEGVDLYHASLSTDEDALTWARKQILGHRSEGELLAGGRLYYGDWALETKTRTYTLCRVRGNVEIPRGEWIAAIAKEREGLLSRHREQREREEYERLKAKFE